MGNDVSASEVRGNETKNTQGRRSLQSHLERGVSARRAALLVGRVYGGDRAILHPPPHPSKGLLEVFGKAGGLKDASVPRNHQPHTPRARVPSPAVNRLRLHAVLQAQRKEQDCPTPFAAPYDGCNTGAAAHWLKLLKGEELMADTVDELRHRCGNPFLFLQSLLVLMVLPPHPTPLAPRCSYPSISKRSPA